MGSGAEYGGGRRAWVGSSGRTGGVRWVVSGAGREAGGAAAAVDAFAANAEILGTKDDAGRAQTESQRLAVLVRDTGSTVGFIAGAACVGAECGAAGSNRAQRK